MSEFSATFTAEAAKIAAQRQAPTYGAPGMVTQREPLTTAQVVPTEPRTAPSTYEINLRVRSGHIPFS